MSDRYYNPFQGIDINVPVQYRDNFGMYCMTGGNAVLDRTPFPRMIDLWFAALCVAINKNLTPVNLSKIDAKDTYKIIDGSIFSSDPWRIQALMLIAIAKFGEVEIVGEPRKIIALVNSYAIAGIPHVIDMLKEGEDEPIWNLSEALEELIGKEN